MPRSMYTACLPIWLKKLSRQRKERAGGALGYPRFFALCALYGTGGNPVLTLTGNARLCTLFVCKGFSLNMGG
jgi:hypothetical protein